MKGYEIKICITNYLRMRLCIYAGAKHFDGC